MAGLRVGFAGIGRMGLPMARNILAAGFELTVYNRNAERCRSLAEAGASVAGTPAELAAEADVLVTMLADGHAVRDVLEGEDGALAGAEPGLVLAEMSTIGPVAAREIAELCATRGVRMVDAPVSGSVAVAEAARLTVMVGGETEAFEVARPLLAAMSSAQLHVGPSGAGAAMKLGLNIMIASAAQSISEALVLAEDAGIAREDAYEVIASSALSSPFVDYKRQAFLDPEGTPTAFALDLMAKDLALALESGRRAAVPLLAASAAAAGVAIAAGLQGGHEDLARIADALRRLGGGSIEHTPPTD